MKFILKVNKYATTAMETHKEHVLLCNSSVREMQALWKGTLSIVFPILYAYI